MAMLTLQLDPPEVRLLPLPEPQLCYALAQLGVTGAAGTRPVNWALVADASRSMRIPIVDEAQFRALIQQGGAQETLVDGVPVWQLNTPAPAELRAVAPSALDHVTRALHAVVERLDALDRFALVACAEEALLLTQSTPGDARADLVRGIERLKDVSLGEQTDLAAGLELVLQELRRGRDGRRAERLLLLTDGFTLRPERCLELAGRAAAEGVAISTVGLGGEFQADLLTALADRSGGRALFLHRPRDIPQAISQELDLARSVAARAVALRVQPQSGARLRRVTRIRPALAQLLDTGAALPDQAWVIPLGDLGAAEPPGLLLELLMPPGLPTPAPLARVTLEAGGTVLAEAALGVRFQRNPPVLPAAVRDAAARANAARLQRRALDAAQAGDPSEAARLLRAAAQRLDELGEPSLAEIARQQAATLAQAGQLPALETKELLYATRRLGETT
jgi:hypothetical protein